GAAAGGVDVNDLLAAALGGALPPPQAAAPVNSTPVVTDPLAVANAASNALDAAFGGTPAVKAEPGRGSGGPTRVLVLLNMVMDEDLASDEDFQMLEEEVREEVSRFGKLLSMKIPRPSVSSLSFPVGHKGQCLREGAGRELRRDLEFIYRREVLDSLDRMILYRSAYGRGELPTYISSNRSLDMRGWSEVPHVEKRFQKAVGWFDLVLPPSWEQTLGRHDAIYLMRRQAVHIF
ncbi:hypothetical protein THAOC_15446, partial [Thalassiosira oceanica]